MEETELNSLMTTEQYNKFIGEIEKEGEKEGENERVGRH
jgi:hypothetical protein